MKRFAMSLSQFTRHIERLRYGKILLMGVFVTLTTVCLYMAFNFTLYSSNRLDERTRQGAREDRMRQQEDHARQVHDLLTNPKFGTTPKQISALSIGMMAEEVESILGLPENLGVEIFPYNYRSGNRSWVVNDIPIKSLGYVQAVFIDRQLVGLGSLDSGDGRLCGGCLQDMLRDKRPWLAGLPFHVEGDCPVCSSNEVVPFGVTLDSLQKSLYR